MNKIEYIDKTYFLFCNEGIFYLDSIFVDSLMRNLHSDIKRDIWQYFNDKKIENILKLFKGEINA